MGFTAQDYLMHHGIKGQKWGVRRFQNSDGTLTEAGIKRNQMRQRHLLQLGDTSKIGYRNRIYRLSNTLDNSIINDVYDKRKARDKSIAVYMKAVQRKYKKLWQIDPDAAEYKADVYISKNKNSDLAKLQQKAHAASDEEFQVTRNYVDQILNTASARQQPFKIKDLVGPGHAYQTARGILNDAISLRVETLDLKKRKKE